MTWLLVSIGDTTTCEVVWRHLYLDFVSWQYTDEVHTHLARYVCRDDMPILELHLEHGIAQCLQDDSILFNSSLFSHIKTLVCLRLL